MEKFVVKPLKRHHLLEITKIVKNTIDSKYRIGENELNQKLFYDRDFCKNASFVVTEQKSDRVVGFVGTKTSKLEEYKGVAWISMLIVDIGVREMGLGSLMMDRVVSSLKDLGIYIIYLGQDFHYFFSGIPEPDFAKKNFFIKHGFNLSLESHYDLVARIKDNNEIDEFIENNNFDEFSISTYKKEDFAQMMEFLEREFSGRWFLEFKKEIEENKNHSKIILLSKDREIVGYCLIYSEKNIYGEKTGYGGLGPIGISRDIRGRGVGSYLLAKSLCELRKDGVSIANIDWTILTGFYGKFGFKKYREYVAGYREI